MKLINPKRNTSFYESFSDLVFGTLVLFVVVVLALALKLRSISDLEVDIEHVVDPYLVAGGALELSSAFCFFPTPEGARIVFIPQEIVAGWNQFREAGPDGPVSMLAAAALAKDGLLVMGEQEFKAFSHGVHARFMDDSVNYLSIGIALFLFDSLRREDPSRFSGLGPEGLAEYIGGYEFPAKVSEAVRSRVMDYNRWLEVYDDGNGTGGIVSEGLSEMFKEGLMRVRFGVAEDDLVHVGGHRITQAAFESFVSSIRPSKDFVLEYCDESGQPTDAPRRIRTGLLARLGYDRRVLSKEGFKALEEKEHG